MTNVSPEKNILVAPLNWGLGHATRCIPIIRALEENGFTPILASDGDALELLRKEFSHLKLLELPSYDIEYPEDGKNFRWKMLKSIPGMMQAIAAEKKTIKKWVKEFDLIGIISDNRPGILNKKVHSVFITHQLNVLTGKTTLISSKLHQKIIDKYDECWVPDFEDKPNLSGKLGHLKKPHPKVRYIGPLSRFEMSDVAKKYDLMVLLSGPEPQRGMLEDYLRKSINQFNGKVVFIRGVVENKQEIVVEKNVTYYNFMTSAELEKTLNESEMVLCRSGYTTIMDLVKLGKKAFFIPTPGQYEQQYLAKKLKKEGIFPSTEQGEFKIGDLTAVDCSLGFPRRENNIHWKNLFCLFAKK